MKQYLALMNDILKYGVEKDDRTGTGTYSIFGGQIRFNLLVGFPLVTTKKIYIRSIIYELLWFLKGDTNINYLKENNVSIWNAWADKNGDLGPIYGKQWRAWLAPNGKTIDQITILIKQIKHNPNSRRLIVSAWNIADLEKMAMAPCHVLFQFYVAKTKLSCQIYQRSADFFLGVPFNISSYALFTHMVAQQCNLQVGELVWTGGDIHLYKNHIKQAQLQLSRKPKPLPQLQINRKPSNIFDYRYEDFNIINYNYYPPIKAPISV